MKFTQKWIPAGSCLCGVCGSLLVASLLDANTLKHLIFNILWFFFFFFCSISVNKQWIIVLFLSLYDHRVCEVSHTLLLFALNRPWEKYNMHTQSWKPACIGIYVYVHANTHTHSYRHRHAKQREVSRYWHNKTRLSALIMRSIAHRHISIFIFTTGVTSSLS